MICTNFGLGSVWIGSFSEDEVRAAIKEKVPLSFIEKPIDLIAIGYCVDEPLTPTSRFSIDELSITLE